MSKLERWDFSPEVIHKATEYLLNNSITRDPDDDHIFWVKSKSGETYRVQLDYSLEKHRIRHAMCNCPHGKHASNGEAKCSHVVCALLKIKTAT